MTSPGGSSIAIGRGGVSVTKRVVTVGERGSGIALRIENRNETRVGVRLFETIPDGVSDDDVGVVVDRDGGTAADRENPDVADGATERWRRADDRTLEFSCIVDGDGTVAAGYVLGIDVAGSELLTEPELAAVLPLDDGGEQSPELPLAWRDRDSADGADDGFGDVAEIVGATSEASDGPREELLAAVRGDRDRGRPELSFSVPDERLPATRDDGPTSRRDGPDDAALPDSTGGPVVPGEVTEALAAELRSGTPSAEAIAELRDVVATDATPSLSTRTERLENEVAKLQAYTDALEAFLDDEAGAEQALSAVRDRLTGVESAVATIRTDLERQESSLAELTDAFEQFRSAFISPDVLDGAEASLPGHDAADPTDESVDDAAGATVEPSDEAATATAESDDDAVDHGADGGGKDTTEVSGWSDWWSDDADRDA